MICNIGISKPTEIKSKKKSIKRHNKLVKKERIAKVLRRQPNGWRASFVSKNNLPCLLTRAFGVNAFQPGTVVFSTTRAEIGGVLK